MTDRAISPLRRRLIEDMTVRGFTPATQQGYLRTVADFTAFSAIRRIGPAPRTCGATRCTCDLRALRRPL